MNMKVGTAKNAAIKAFGPETKIMCDEKNVARRAAYLDKLTVFSGEMG